MSKTNLQSMNILFDDKLDEFDNDKKNEKKF